FFVEDIGKDAPSAVDRDFALKFGKPVQPFKDSEIRIDSEFVAVDARVGMAAEHLVVAGIRERETVGDMSHTASGLVAEDLSLFCDDVPKEWKEGAAPFSDVVSPIVAAQTIHIVPDATIFFVQQRGIGAAKNFLPTQTIADDQN